MANKPMLKRIVKQGKNTNEKRSYYEVLVEKEHNRIKNALKEAQIDVESYEVEDSTFFVMVKKEISDKYQWKFRLLSYFLCGVSMEDESCCTYRVAVKFVENKNNYRYEDFCQELQKVMAT